ncbi:hypothetical protein EYF80_008507 [Liparis tanakae]|uniref:Uncharacterized protein n=1 Tax=Liparis tanakae TaxID=230148 RepID=A0A4Z2IVC5_9TELE|nr:hypothetical protein EYF80_008507 [Liparis tanakae]
MTGKKGWSCCRITPVPLEAQATPLFIRTPVLNSQQRMKSLSLCVILRASLCFVYVAGLVIGKCMLVHGAVRIPARRGGGVCDPRSIRTRPPLHAIPSLVFTLTLTPSLGKWMHPPSWQGTGSPLRVLPAVAAET